MTNTTGTQRTGIITAAGKQITVVQEGGGTVCTYTTSPNSGQIPAEGGQLPITISTSGACEWTASLSSSCSTWLSLDKTSGTGTGTVTVTAQPNTGLATRTGMVNVVNKTIYISQTGGASGCTYSVTPTTASHSASAAAGTIAVTSSSSTCAWSASTSTSWITLTKTSFTGSATVNYSVSANTGAGSRSGSITVAGKTVTVTQQGASGCSVTLTPSSASFSTSGGNGNSFDVTASASTCAWTATTASNWITITTGSGTGDGKVYYNVASNSGSQRTGTIYVAGSMFTITQAGNTSGCVYSLSLKSCTVLAEGQSKSVAIEASSTSCSWTATTEYDWITVLTTSGYGSMSIRFSVAANTGPSRTGTIQIADQTMTVIQESGGGSCDYQVSPTTITQSASGGTGNVTVTTGDSCTWSAASSETWVSLNKTGGTGSGTVSYTIAANTGAQRAATLTIAGKSVTVTQYAGVSECTYSISPASRTIVSDGATGQNFNVTVTGTNCSWTAAANDDWITITSGGSGSETGTVYYSVAANSGTTQRVGSITAGGQTHTITQLGSSWSQMNGRTNVLLESVWGASPTYMFVVGAEGSIQLGDGTSWSAMTSNTDNGLKDVWGTSASNVYAVGESGTIQRFNGVAWSSVDSGITETLNAVHGATANMIFAVGDGGKILSYNGSIWTAMYSGVSVNLNGVWIVSPTSAYAVGDSGTILHYDGTSWSAMDSGVSANLEDVYAPGLANVYAVGQSGTILHFDGQTWADESQDGVTLNLKSVNGESATEVYAVGTSSGLTSEHIILGYDGSSWTNRKQGDTYGLYGVWSDGSDRAYAVGQNGVILTSQAIQNPVAFQGWDAQAYLDANPDLALAGFTTANALMHYKLYGFSEGRSLSFDAQAYLNANPDLAGQVTEATALYHYNRYGKAEGRPTAFDNQSYLDANPELVQAGVTTDTALDHYWQYGRAQGRIEWFDSMSYLAANPNISGYSDATALYHYEAYGKTDNRFLAFDGQAYLDMHPEVAAAGYTAATAINHYMGFGQYHDYAYVGLRAK